MENLKEFSNKVEQKWIELYKDFPLKRGTKKYQEMHNAFFAGAMVASDNYIPYWIICISVCRDILDLVEKKIKEEAKELLENKKVINIKFKGIDNYNRPVYKDINSNMYFGSTKITFAHYTKENIINNYFKDNLDELEYFGNSFNCEPHGGHNDKYKFNIIE